MPPKSAAESLAQRLAESQPASLVVKAYTAGALSVKFDMESETPMRDARDWDMKGPPTKWTPRGDNIEL